MKFKLLYRGEIKTHPKRRREHVHDIRLHFHHQLKRLYNIPPYTSLRKCFEGTGQCPYNIIRTVRNVHFIPLICPELHLLAELEVNLLHPELLETPRGDIDNRMKTLLDALKRPQEATEVPPDVKDNERIFTLLDDDRLVTKLSVNTSHLLDTDLITEDFMMIMVTLKASQGTLENLPLVI